MYWGLQIHKITGKIYTEDIKIFAKKGNRTRNADMNYKNI